MIHQLFEWQLITEVFHRCPPDSVITQTLSSNGRINRLSLRLNDNPRHRALDVVTGGPIVLTVASEIYSFNDWKSRLLLTPLQLVQLICERMGLSDPKEYGNESPALCAYRFIASCIADCFRYEDRTCQAISWTEQNKIQRDFSSEFPFVKDLAESSTKFTHHENPYWFIVCSERPEICVDIRGTAYSREGNTLNLTNLYQLAAEDQQQGILLPETHYGMSLIESYC